LARTADCRDLHVCDVTRPHQSDHQGVTEKRIGIAVRDLPGVVVDDPNAAHENRGHSVPVTVTQGIESTKKLVNMRRASSGGYKSLGTISANKGQTLKVRVDAKGAGGVVHADAVQLVELD
jgi:hypothetical protein